MLEDRDGAGPTESKRHPDHGVNRSAGHAEEEQHHHSRDHQGVERLSGEEENSFSKVRCKPINKINRHFFNCSCRRDRRQLTHYISQLKVFKALSYPSPCKRLDGKWDLIDEFMI